MLGKQATGAIHNGKFMLKFKRPKSIAIRWEGGENSQRALTLDTVWGDRLFIVSPLVIYDIALVPAGHVAYNIMECTQSPLRIP